MSEMAYTSFHWLTAVMSIIIVAIVIALVLMHRVYSRGGPVFDRLRPLLVIIVLVVSFFSYVFLIRE